MSSPIRTSGTPDLPSRRSSSVRRPLHIDAAYGGLLTLSPRHRHKLQGLHRAHS
ncbi:pyridoxal-dependent decarboxylase, partial [Streptomyces goshikiensis]|uniref:pyridoxal-dependent decarboxylase n=1 Tax=Streptomyces goshikiensis TaxID=1942 RepID=UPI003D9F8378